MGRAWFKVTPSLSWFVLGVREQWLLACSLPIPFVLGLVRASHFRRTVGLFLCVVFCVCWLWWFFCVRVVFFFFQRIVTLNCVIFALVLPRDEACMKCLASNTLLFF